MEEKNAAPQEQQNENNSQPEGETNPNGPIRISPELQKVLDSAPIAGTILLGEEPEKGHTTETAKDATAAQPNAPQSEEEMLVIQAPKLPMKPGEITTKTLENGEVETSITIEMSTKTMLIYTLLSFVMSGAGDVKTLNDVKRVMAYFDEHLDTLIVEPKEEGSVSFNLSFGISYKEERTEEEIEAIKAQILEYFQRDFVLFAVAKITNREDDFWAANKQLQAAVKAKQNEGRPKARKKVVKGTLRLGGHAADNMLKKPRRSKKPELWDTLKESTQRELKEQNVTIDFINYKGEGIKLTTAQWRLIIALQRLLHEKSENVTQPKKPGYYSGNKPSKEVKLKEDGNPYELTLRAPGIGITLYELAKAYNGGEAIGGENVRVVEKMMGELFFNSQLWPLIRYTHIEVVDTKKKIERHWKIERRRPLLSFDDITVKTLQEGKKIDEHQETVIYLNPVFIDQIGHKYVELPLTIIDKLIGASGGKDYTQVANLLILELARAHSNRRSLKKDEEGNYIFEYGLLNTSNGEAGLFWVIGENYMNRRQPTKLKPHYEEAVSIAKKIGLLVKYEERYNQAGEPIGVFTLAKKWGE